MASCNVGQRLQSLISQKTHNVPAKTPFDSAAVPPISVVDYVQRLSKCTKATAAAEVVAGGLLMRFLVRTRTALTLFNVHRLYLSSFVIALKLLEDEQYSMRHYARTGGIDVAELAQLESVFLQRIEWDLGLQTLELPKPSPSVRGRSVDSTDASSGSESDSDC
eukprot:CAMPEP_0204275084 /NCGR_PEP_ID=MMETSP0468-20130131/25553_1 /ASSEMBLY_ACC=CAM_ASM_000383 /TAXON_ID=2969 /ORGANISM="Oxyrrhis marina" /LENGTH=163 /DNA_ID=CAMNT_0051251375 /DNA_START=40 /DNA_END=531 /DNA_ORIENTATION=-